MPAAALVCLAVAAPRAQTPSPYLAEIKRYYYEAMKRNVSAMAEKMPEEHFAFKPVPEMRSFGESVAHVADAQARNCNLVSGAGSKTVDAEKKRTKAESARGAQGVVRNLRRRVRGADRRSGERHGQDGTIRLPADQAVAAREHDRAFQRAARLHGGLSQAQRHRAAVDGSDERQDVDA